MRYLLLMIVLLGMTLKADMASLFHLETYDKDNPAVLGELSSGKKLFVDGSYELFSEDIDGITNKEKTLGLAQARAYIIGSEVVYSVTALTTLVGEQRDPRVGNPIDISKTGYGGSLSMKYLDIPMGISYDYQTFESIGFSEISQKLMYGLQYDLQSATLGVIAGFDLLSNTYLVEGNQLFLGVSYSKDVSGTPTEVSVVYKPETYTIGSGALSSNYQKEYLGLNLIFEKAIGEYDWLVNIDYIEEKSYKSAIASKSLQGVTLTRLDDKYSFFFKYQISSQANIEDTSMIIGVTIGGLLD